MSQPKLTPRDGQGPDKRLMSEIEKLTQNEAAAIMLLAKQMESNREAVDDTYDVLCDIRDMIAKVCMNFSIALPLGMQKAMEEGDYNPDAVDGDDDEEDDDDAEIVAHEVT